MEITITNLKPDKNGRTWSVRVRLCTLEPMREVSRHYTFAEAREALRDIMR